MIPVESVPRLGCEDGDEFVDRQQQLSLRKTTGRGRGKGRGRGRGAKPAKDIDHEKTKDSAAEVDKKRRKIATPQNSHEHEPFWTEEMEQEWAKWKGYGEEDWLEEDWKNDWGQPGKAFDRYVNMDGQVSLQKLKCMEGSNHKSSGKAEKTGGDKPGEKQDVEGKKKAKKVDNTSGKKRKEPEVQDVQDVEDESDEEPVQPALDQKQQVNAIAKFLRAFKAKGYKLKKHEDITEEMKTQWKKDFPVTDECRYSNYWKRPATGVFLKSEKKDFGSYSVSSELGPFDLRLAASLKAAGLLATRKKKMNNHFRFHSLKKSLKRGGVPFWVFFVTSTQFLSFCLCCSFSEI